MLPIFGVLHICAFLKRPFLQLLHSALADLHVCSLHPGYLVLRSTWYLPLLYHFASSFPVSTALGDITCNSPAIWVGLVVGGKTWRGGEKEGKEGIGCFSCCSRTDTAFCVQGEGNLERAMPIRHHDMQRK